MYLLASCIHFSRRIRINIAAEQIIACSSEHAVYYKHDVEERIVQLESEHDDRESLTDKSELLQVVYDVENIAKTAE